MYAKIYSWYTIQIILKFSTEGNSNWVPLLQGLLDTGIKIVHMYVTYLTTWTSRIRYHLRKIQVRWAWKYENVSKAWIREEINLYLGLNLDLLSRWKIRHFNPIVGCALPRIQRFVKINWNSSQREEPYEVWRTSFIYTFSIQNKDDSK